MPPIAAIQCPYCGFHTGTPHFSKDADGYTLCIIICNSCGRDLP